MELTASAFTTLQRAVPNIERQVKHFTKRPTTKNERIHLFKNYTQVEDLYGIACRRLSCLRTAVLWPGPLVSTFGVIHGCTARAVRCGSPDFSPNDSGRRSPYLDSVGGGTSSRDIVLGISRRWVPNEEDTGEKRPQSEPNISAL